MKILALDTATEACSAALLIDDQVIERCEFAPRRHADLIMPMIGAVLAEAGLTVVQLDALAFGRGPGSFTGVRIAAGVVQGIAFAADLPVVPISTLAAIARCAMGRPGVRQVAAAIDARMGEIYWGTYRTGCEGGVILVGQERVCLPAAVGYAEDGEWFGAGSGWAVYADTLQQFGLIKAWWGDCCPQAGDISVLAGLTYRRGEFVTADQAMPVYLRDQVVQKTNLSDVRAKY